MKGHFFEANIKKALQEFITDCQIFPIEKGVSSFTYKLVTTKSNYYLTISKNKDESLLSRFNGLQLLKEKGCLVTKPFAFKDFSGDLDGHSFLITHEVNGNSIENLETPQLSKILRNAGRSLAISHSIKLNGFGYTTSIDSKGMPMGNLPNYYIHLAEKIRYEDNIENKVNALVEFNVISKKDASKLLMFIDRNRKLLDIKQGVLIHGDFSNEHIFADEKMNFTGIIDWDGMASGSPIYDLAQYSTYYPQNLNSLLEGYFSISGKIELFEERLFLERLLYCIGKTAKAYVKKKADTESYFSTAQKVLLNDLKSL